MIGRLRQLSEPRLRLQAGIEKYLTPVERDILVQWVRNIGQIVWVSGMINMVACPYMVKTLRTLFLQNKLTGSLKT